MTHRVSGGDYEGAAADDVAITIVERVLPTIAVEDARGSEASDGLEFVISLDAAGPRAVSVGYDTLSGSGVGEARHLVDYRGKGGQIEFSPGETEKRLRVRLLNDDWHEGEEAFKFTLSNPMDGRLPDDQLSFSVRGVAEDGEPMPTAALALSDSAIGENGGEAAVVVSPQLLGVAPGGSAAYRVVLETEPTADVRVRCPARPERI